MKTIFSGLFAVVVSATATTITAADDAVRGTLTIFHAGSLSVPFKEIGTAFKQRHPAVEIRYEAAGSRECARKVSDLGKHCDILASADYQVIDQLLIPQHATWNITFASNEMAIVYRPQSRRAAEINANNWSGILLDPVVAFGRADPNADPCGYRAVLTMKLAEKASGQTGLADRLLAKDTRYIRPKEVDLLAQLESGTLDYLFLYRSVAYQHGLKFLVLPDQVNLKNPAQNPLYASVSVELTGKTPGSTITQRGEAMAYGVTIPSAAANPVAALAFVRFLLTADQGMAIMERQGQPSLIPAPSATWATIPAELQAFAKPVAK